MILQDMVKKGRIHPPNFVADNCHYLVESGSQSYGCADPDSDVDLFGWCMPPKGVMLPHTVGHINGFTEEIPKFDSWQQHHVFDTVTAEGNPALGAVEYDFNVYGLIRFANLVLEGNPNMVDTLFVPSRCIRHCTSIGRLLYDSRRMFLHKGCYHRYRGYCFSQISKEASKHPQPGSKRYILMEKFGYDPKYMYNVVRLMLECQQILETGDLHLDRDSAMYRSIRAGEWSRDKVLEFHQHMEPELENLYRTSTLQHSPDKSAIKALLLRCIEEHYGSVGIVLPGVAEQALQRIANIVHEQGYIR